MFCMVSGAVYQDDLEAQSGNGEHEGANENEVNGNGGRDGAADEEEDEKWTNRVELEGDEWEDGACGIRLAECMEVRWVYWN